MQRNPGHSAGARVQSGAGVLVALRVRAVDGRPRALLQRASGHSAGPHWFGLNLSGLSTPAGTLTSQGHVPVGAQPLLLAAYLKSAVGCLSPCPVCTGVPPKLGDAAEQPRVMLTLRALWLQDQETVSSLDQCM